MRVREGGGEAGDRGWTLTRTLFWATPVGIWSSPLVSGLSGAVQILLFGAKSLSTINSPGWSVSCCGLMACPSYPEKTAVGANDGGALGTPAVDADGVEVGEAVRDDKGDEDV